MRLIRNKGKLECLLLMMCLLAGFMLLFLTEQSFSQPPPLLPESPEQTPIDGGLGILAALGGAYAIKKLRDKE